MNYPIVKVPALALVLTRGKNFEWSFFVNEMNHSFLDFWKFENCFSALAERVCKIIYFLRAVQWKTIEFQFQSKPEFDGQRLQMAILPWFWPQINKEIKIDRWIPRLKFQEFLTFPSIKPINDRFHRLAELIVAPGNPGIELWPVQEAMHFLDAFHPMIVLIRM